MKQGIVWRDTEGLFRYQGWPSVCCDENGVLYAVASGKRMGHVCPFGKNLMYISRDGGEHWSSPIIVNDSINDDRDTGVLCMGGGRLLVSWFNLDPSYHLRLEKAILQNHFGHGHTPTLIPTVSGAFEVWRNIPNEQFPRGSFVRLSSNGGFTWSQPYSVPVSSPHGPNLMQNGNLLYMGNLNQERHDGGAVAVCESLDGGKTWTVKAEVPLPEGLQGSNMREPHILQLPNGALLGAIRAQGREVEAATGESFTIYLTRSTDGGNTWTVPEPTGFCGSPPHLLLHSSGAVILSYGRRKLPYRECARISHDGGVTWSEELVLNDQSPHEDMGYPCTAELPDGSLITVYYQMVPGDDHPSVLYTKWELPKT